MNGSAPSAGDALSRAVRGGRNIPHRRHPAFDPRAGDRRERWAHNLSYVWGGLILLGMLLAPQFGALGIVAVLVVIGAGFFPVMLARPGDLAAGWPQLLYPSLAVLSFLWSNHPDFSIRFSIQLVITILASLVISLSRHSRNMVIGVAVAQVLYFIVSIALGQTNKTGVEGTIVFTGLNAGKNYFADLTILSMIATMALIWLGISKRSRAGLLLAFAGVGLVIFEIMAIRSAGSAGALLAMFGPIAIFILLGWYRIVGNGGRSAMVVIGAASLAVAGPVAYFEGPQIYAEVLRAFNKNPSTLTGRTYLWYRAEAIMEEAPILGTGIGAFWVQGDSDPEGLWAYSQIRSRVGFTFHNTMIETRVNLGWAGYCAFMLACIAGAIALIRRSLYTPDVIAAFYLAILTYEFPRFSFEALVPSPFSPTSLLIAAALSAGFSRHASSRHGGSGVRLP